MTKELEALEDFKIIKFKTINAGYDYGYEVWDKIEQSLLELQAIKKAKPSEALGKLNVIEENLTYKLRKLNKIGNQKLAIETAVNLADKFEEAIKPIKQALLKAEKLEKALKIIIGKTVNIFEFKYALSLKEYNCKVNERKQLTQEEFDLLKEMLE